MRHERSMWVKPGRTWETLLENDWIREYFKIKACNQPRPRSRRGSCMLYDSSMTALSQGTAGPHPACTSHHHTCSLDHVAPTCHSVALATLTMSHLHTSQLHLQCKPHPARTRYLPNCNLDQVPPVSSIATLTIQI